jgi:Big-like domain-containing protein
MKTSTNTLLRLALAVALVGSAVTAEAALQDHGTADPVINFPVWYRDLNGVALQQCRSTTPSPNAAAGLVPMCFPFAADPAGFPGNIGGELFYSDAGALLAGPGFSLRYTAALEMAYMTGVPTKGQEIVFARIRIVIAPTVPGTYKVTHPYGVEIFPDVGTGPRAVFFTEDIVPIPGNFDAALGGRLGPYLQWDQLLPGESLTNSAGEQFLGDPNYVHTFTGSPFGTNYVRVDGPVGSNLDGVGNDFIQTPLASILGQKYLAPIPSPLRVNRAVYSRNPASAVNTVDVWATAPTGAKLLLTGTDLPSVAMKSSGNAFFAHVEIPAGVPLPAGISVTNVSDNPPTTVTAGLGDAVNITSATFDTLTNTLTVTAVSSDLSVPPPALVVEGLFGGPMTAGTYSGVMAATSLPPLTVTVVSAAGGVDTDDLIILRGLPLNPASPPVALADAITTNSNVAATVSLTANDTSAAALASLVVTQVPTNGTVTLDPVTLGTVTYTPALNYSGPDNFSYVITDSAGAVSNVGFVTVTVTFAAAPPVANGDNWAQVRGSTRTVSVIANDKAGIGTTLDAASLLLASAPLHGAATTNPDGTITYTPVATYAGPDTFTYTVKNNAGQASNAATVSVFVSAAPETLVFQRVLYTTRTGSYTIVGSTSVFGPTLTPSVTCWMGRTAGVAANRIGTAPVTVTGGFSVVSVGAVPAPDATRSVVCQSTNGAVVATAVTLK